MTFEEWVRRMETIIGEPAKMFAIKGDEYVCTFRGMGKRKVKVNELKDEYPFYVLSHFYYPSYGTYTQIFVNKKDFIQIIWNRKGKNIAELTFNYQFFRCSKETFSQVSEKYREVADWVHEYYVLNAKNSEEIIACYKGNLD